MRAIQFVRFDILDIPTTPFQVIINLHREGVGDEEDIIENIVPFDPI